MKSKQRIEAKLKECEEAFEILKNGPITRMDEFSINDYDQEIYTLKWVLDEEDEEKDE